MKAQQTGSLVQYAMHQTGIAASKDKLPFSKRCFTFGETASQTDA